MRNTFFLWGLVKTGIASENMRHLTAYDKDIAGIKGMNTVSCKAASTPINNMSDLESCMEMQNIIKPSYFFGLKNHRFIISTW